MSKRKDTYVEENQKCYYLNYRLIHHEEAGETSGAGYYGIVVEQYEISPICQQDTVAACPEAQKESTGRERLQSRGLTRPADRFSDQLSPYRVGDSGKGLTCVERCEITGLSESEEEAEKFLDMICDGKVVPESLFEVYDDWMSAFHPRWDEKVGRSG